jgi:hypothetical protein
MVKDQEEQVRLLKSCGDNHWQIKNFIVNAKPLLKWALFDQDRYEKEGGTFIVDLFNDHSTVNDVRTCANHELFWTLQNAAIEEEILRLEKQGWKQVSKVTSAFAPHNSWPWKKEITTKKTRKQHTLFYAVHAHGEFEVFDKVQPSPEAVKAKREAEKAMATPDREAVQQMEQGPATGATDEAQEMADKRPFSQALTEDLRRHRGMMVKIALTRNTLLALKVLLFTLMRGRKPWQMMPANIKWTASEPREPIGAYDTLKGVQEISAECDPGALWKWIDDVGLSQIEEHLAHIMAAAFDPQIVGSFSMARVILNQEPVEPRIVWSPIDEFWEQAGKAYMLRVLEKLVGPVEAQRQATRKAADLAAMMHHWFEKPYSLRYLDFGGKDEPLPEEKQKAIADWAPAALQLPDRDAYNPQLDLDQLAPRSFDDEEDEAAEQQREDGHVNAELEDQDNGSDGLDDVRPDAAE